MHSERPSLYLHDGCWLGKIDLSRIGLIPRVLLTTNGTLTHVLEACFLEHINVCKLAQHNTLRTFQQPYLTIATAENIMVRKILLQGQRTQRHYVYAESFVLCDRLSEPVRQELTHTDTPIGKVLNHHQVESYKRFVAYHQEPAAEIGQYFALAADQQIFSRTFVVYSHQQPIMVITEKIPPLES